MTNPPTASSAHRRGQPKAECILTDEEPLAFQLPGCSTQVRRGAGSPSPDRGRRRPTARGAGRADRQVATAPRVTPRTLGRRLSPGRERCTESAAPPEPATTKPRLSDSQDARGARRLLDPANSWPALSGHPERRRGEKDRPTSDHPRAATPIGDRVPEDEARGQLTTPGGVRAGPVQPALIDSSILSGCPSPGCVRICIAGELHGPSRQPCSECARVEKPRTTPARRGVGAVALAHS